jgi:hypothetical protein
MTPPETANLPVVQFYAVTADGAKQINGLGVSEPISAVVLKNTNKDCLIRVMTGGNDGWHKCQDKETLIPVTDPTSRLLSITVASQSGNRTGRLVIATSAKTLSLRYVCPTSDSHEHNYSCLKPAGYELRIDFDRKLKDLLFTDSCSKDEKLENVSHIRIIEPKPRSCVYGFATKDGGQSATLYVDWYDPAYAPPRY